MASTMNRCPDSYTQDTIKFINKKSINPVSSNLQKGQFADICYKKSNGSNNWTKFKEAEKKSNILNSNIKPSNPCITNKKNKLTNVSSANKVKDILKPQVKIINDNKEPFLSSKSPLTGNRNFNKPAVMKHNKSKNLTKCIAIDCEMVGVDEDAKTNMLARVSLVNSYGDCVYDKFVKPLEPVVDYRTFVSGIRPKDLENGEDFSKVQKDVAEILKGRTLVGHALKNDLNVLFLTHPRGFMRDTARYKRLQEGFKTTPSLKKLTEKYLGVNIQEGEHNSIEDAKASMMLYMMFKKDWEAEFRKKGQKKRPYKTIDLSKQQQMIRSVDV